MTAGLVEFVEARLADDERECAFNGDPESWCDRAEGVHYDSRRVLREVYAKRRLLALHGRAHRCPNHLETDVGPCLTLLLLAAPFRDHEAFDPSWAVEDPS